MEATTFVHSLTVLVRGTCERDGRPRAHSKPEVTSDGCECCEEGADEVECHEFLDAVAEMCRTSDGAFAASRLHPLLEPEVQRLLKQGVNNPDSRVAATTLQLLALLARSSEAVGALLREGALQQGVLLDHALQRSARGNPQSVRHADVRMCLSPSHVFSFISWLTKTSMHSGLSS